MKNLDNFTSYCGKINEEVSNQTLYHYTTLSNLYLILKSDKMIARFVGDSSSDKWRKVSRKSISFCRKYLTMDQLRGIQDGVNDPIRIIIHFDSDKLKEKYKIVPWSDERSKSNEINNSQFEERCVSDIEDVKKYIIRIQVIFDEIITGFRFNETNIKNDGIRLSSGKDDSIGNLPWEEFINSEFFKKSFYSLLSLDKDLKRNFNEIINNISTYSGKGRSGNTILESSLLICLWNWWFFNKTRKLAQGITFDFQDKKIKNNKFGNIKLSSPSKDLIQSLTGIKDALLKDLKVKYDEQNTQISRSDESDKKYQKNTEKEKKEKEEKSKQEVRDKENLNKWRKEADIKKEREREIHDKKYKETKNRLESKLNSELSKDESYLGIVKWVESNIRGSKVYDESKVSEFFNYLRYSSYEIKDSNVSSVVVDNSEQISKLINNCRDFNEVDKIVLKCKELMTQIKKSLDGVKKSTLSKIKKFLSIN
jgi:hypothetical protein